MSDPHGSPWLEEALGAWAERQRLPESRADAVAFAVVQDATPELPLDWWRTIFPSLRARAA
ncbi:MAG: hypothetical protein ACO1SV_21975 [Fimbriimonas sp.]